MDKQMNLSALSDELSQVRTQKKEFLTRIDHIVPWGECLALIISYYCKGERDIIPYGLERMSRISFVQNLYNLSDMGSVTELTDRLVFQLLWGRIQQLGC